MNKNHVIALVSVLAAGLIGFALGRNSDFKLEIKSGEHTATLDVKGASVDYEKVLEVIYSNDFLRGAAKQWLADKHSILAVSDERLASLLEKKACGSVPESPLLVKLKALKQCAEASGNLQLRDLAFRRRGYPFHPVGYETRMSVPGKRKDFPAPETAAVCDRDLFGRKVEIYNATLDKTIYVRATGLIDCSGFTQTGTQLHLNPEDAKNLFGGVEPLGINVVYVLPTF
jgi:hypothetical protein